MQGRAHDRFVECQTRISAKQERSVILLSPVLFLHAFSVSDHPLYLPLSFSCDSLFVSQRQTMNCQFLPEYDKSSATPMPPRSTSAFMPDQSSSEDSSLNRVLSLPMEKRRIKEGMIAAEVRRRELEEEIRMELMVERETAKQHLQGFSPSGSMCIESPLSFDFNFAQGLLKFNPVDGNFGRRLALMDSATGRNQKLKEITQLFRENDVQIGEKLLGAASDFGCYGSFDPVEQRREVNLLEGGAKPGILTSSSSGVLDSCPVLQAGEVNSIGERLFIMNQKEDTALGKQPFQRHPDATAIIGKSHNVGEASAMPQLRIDFVKRKAETLRRMSEEKMAGVQGKKPNMTWFCSLCEVPATSQKLFDKHLQGKKHKAKEATQTSDEDVNKRDGNSSKKSKELVVCSGKIGLEGQNCLKNDQQTDETAGSEATSAENLENGGSVKPELNWQKTPYYCEMCNVSLNRKAQMDGHNKGKKHLSLLQKNGVADGNSCVKSQELAEFTGSSNLQEAKHLENEQNIKRDGNFIVPEPSKLEEHETAVSQNQNPSLRKGRFWCKMCDVRTDSEDQMNDHRRGKEHMTLLQKKGGAVIVVANRLKLDDVEAYDGQSRKLTANIS